MNSFSLVNGLSDSERLALMGRMYDLLGRQTTKYLAGDSTSIPVETAEVLLRSLTNTLRLTLSETGMPERELLTNDLDTLLRQGQHILQEKLAIVRGLWEQACLTIPQMQNFYLQDTLKGIGDFLKRYDLWYFAHQIPCVIDYPLCVPISEELLGVSYVEKWLRHFLIENWILSRFQQQTVRHLLSGIAADYWEYPMNLCEQPLINALGLTLLNRTALPLELSDKDCHAIGQLLLDCNDLKAEIDRGIISLVVELGVPKEAETYMRAVLYNTLPRIQSALQHGSVNGIFIVW